MITSKIFRYFPLGPNVDYAFPYINTQQTNYIFPQNNWVTAIIVVHSIKIRGCEFTHITLFDTIVAQITYVVVYAGKIDVFSFKQFICDAYDRNILKDIYNNDKYIEGEKREIFIGLSIPKSFHRGWISNDLIYKNIHLFPYSWRNNNISQVTKDIYKYFSRHEEVLKDPNSAEEFVSKFNNKVLVKLRRLGESS